MLLASSPSQPLSVRSLNLQVKEILELQLTEIWLEGEVSNWSCPQSGHWYFTLKDAHAQVASVCFRMQQPKTAITDGMRVLCRAKVSLYAPRGNYQLIVQEIRPAGSGALEAMLRALQERLQKEGLFDQAHKKPLPTYPMNIGIITSGTGAALQDVKSVLTRRFPIAQIKLYEALVQGDTASASLRQALAIAVSDNSCDTLIICRGGGSLEDLWPFNDEGLIRDLYACPIPLISGVGHEIDTTLCDAVCDWRAATPSAAAEAATPDWQELLQTLDHRIHQLRMAATRVWLEKSNQLNQLEKRLQHPSVKLTEWGERFKAQEKRMLSCLQLNLTQRHHQLSTHQWRLAQSMNNRRQYQQQRLHQQQRQLFSYPAHFLQHAEQQLLALSDRLSTLSPLNTLKRGYAVTQNNTGDTISSCQGIQTEDNLTIIWHDGQCQVKVIKH